MENNSTEPVRIYATKTDVTVNLESRQRLLEDYEIVYVTLSGPNPFKSPVLDIEALDRKVLSSACINAGGDLYRVYYLLNKNGKGGEAQKVVNRAIHSRLRELEGEEESERATKAVGLTDPMEIPDWVLRNLLLGAIKNIGIGPNEPERSDIGSGLYLYWGEGQEEGEIVTLSYKFNREGVLQQYVVTYTLLSMFPRDEKGEFRDKSLNKEPRYRYEKKRGAVCREFDRDSGEELYVNRKKNDRIRNTIIYFSFPGVAFTAQGDLTEAWEKFEDSRMMHLTKVTKKFNEIYEKYGITIKFRDYKQTGEEKTNLEATRKNRDAIQKALDGVTVNVVNTDPLHEDDAKKLEKTLGEIKESEFGEYSKIYVQRSNEPDPDCLNIILIHDKDYYKNNEVQDPHGDYPQYQHLTYENWRRNSLSRPSIARVCILEAREKKDITNGHISLADCSVIPETMYFVKDFFWINSSRQKIHRYVAMRMEPDGTIEFAMQTPRRRDLNFENCFPGFDCKWFDHVRAKDNAEYAVRMGKDLNLIRNTGIRTIIDPKVAEKALDPHYNQNEGVKRDKKTRDHELAGLIGIRSFNMDGKICYICGIKDYAPPREIARATLIRECLPVGESRDLTEYLLPLMCVDFVRLNQLTVNPFPIKYMRELLRMSGETVDGE